MPRNKRKHPISRYERIMLAAIDSLPFKFNSPGEPNPYKPVPPNTKQYKPSVEEHRVRMQPERNPDWRSPRARGILAEKKARPPKQERDLMN
jgi:hypothetical protein